MCSPDTVLLICKSHYSFTCVCILVCVSFIWISGILTHSQLFVSKTPLSSSGHVSTSYSTWPSIPTKGGFPWPGHFYNWSSVLVLALYGRWVRGTRSYQGGACNLRVTSVGFRHWGTMIWSMIVIQSLLMCCKILILVWTTKRWLTHESQWDEWVMICQCVR